MVTKSWRQDSSSAHHGSPKQNGLVHIRSLALAALMNVANLNRAIASWTTNWLTLGFSARTGYPTRLFDYTGLGGYPLLPRRLYVNQYMMKGDWMWGKHTLHKRV